MSNVSEQSSVIDEASAWFDLGCALQDAEQHQDALSAFRQAAAIDSEFPFLRRKIAAALFYLQNYSEGLQLCEAIVRDTPGNFEAWTGLCANAHRCREWDKSLAAAERAFQLNPHHPMQLFNYFTILCEFRRFKKARHLLDRAVSLTPEVDNLQLSLGLVQLAEGDFKNGWKNLQARWGRIKKFSDMAGSLGPQWSGESLTRKIVVIWPEIWQGHGDLILFVRYAARLAERAKREDGLIIFSCFDPLYTLFARSLVEHCNELSVTAFAKGMELQPQHFLGRKVFQCPLMSLPLLLGDTIPDKFPYLTPNPTKVEFWRKRLAGDNNLKVGLSWTGRADHPRNDLRSINIIELTDRLKDIPSVTFYSLQLGQSEWSKQAQASELVDFTSELASFDDTAALVSNLDLVIGVDAVICHLAGALNIPTWVMVDVNPYWGWGRYKPTTVWYKSVTIYRQKRMHRWEEVFEEIRSDLRARIHL